MIDSINFRHQLLCHKQELTANQIKEYFYFRTKSDVKLKICEKRREEKLLQIKN